MRAHSAAAIAATLALYVLAGCKVGPNYKRPNASVPPALKASPPSSATGVAWKDAGVDIATLPANWWEMYRSDELNWLETQLNRSNQDVKTAYHAYEVSRDQVKIDRSSLFPTIGATTGASRDLASANRPFALPNRENQYADLTLEGRAAWEPDLWGKVRRTVESSAAAAQASAADLANVRLSVQAELAVDYFQLRALDSQQQLLDETVASYKKVLNLTQKRLSAGLSSASDVALAQTQLDQTVAQAEDVGVARAQYENAIATLTGTPASSFRLLPNSSLPALPPAPSLIPSQLLERRPDIAAAERRVAAANANIGVAQAAFYPTLDLGAAGGFESVSAGTWINGSSTLWSLGASAAETVFDAGRRRAVKQQAVDTYQESASRYRQTVLQSFQEVEDNLAALRILESEARAQNRAVQDAQRSVDISVNRYRNGLASFLEVATVQATLLSNQRVAVDVTAREATASVQLFKAVGGGWTTAQLPR